MSQGQQGSPGRLSPLRDRAAKARAKIPALDVVARAFGGYSEHGDGTQAAALTYYMFFSIFPLLLFAAAALGYLTFGNEELKRDLIARGIDSIPLVRDVLDPQSLDRISDQRARLALGGLVLALYTGSGAVLGLQNALDRIDGVDRSPGFWSKRLRSLAWLALLGSTGLASLALSGVAGVAAAGQPSLATILGVAGALAISLGLFATAFKFLPAARRAWRDVLPGAVLAAVAFEVLKAVGSWYLGTGSGARNEAFGRFAAAAALLVACHLVAQVTLVAAEVNHALAQRTRSRQSSGAG